MMTALDVEFEKALHYHDEAYKSDEEYGLPTQVMRPVHIYSVSTTEASFNLAEYKQVQHAISSFMPRQPRDNMPFCEGVCQHLTFDETPPPTP